MTEAYLVGGRQATCPPNGLTFSRKRREHHVQTSRNLHAPFGGCIVVLGGCHIHRPKGPLVGRAIAEAGTAGAASAFRIRCEI